MSKPRLKSKPAAFVGKPWFPNTAVCRCGCGVKIKSITGHRKRLFAGTACRSRFMRQRKADAGIAKRAPWTAMLDLRRRAGKGVTKDAT